MNATQPANLSGLADRMALRVEGLLAESCGNRVMGCLFGPLFWIYGKLMARRIRRDLERLLAILRQLAADGLPAAPAIADDRCETGRERSDIAGGDPIRPDSTCAERPSGFGGERAGVIPEAESFSAWAEEPGIRSCAPDERRERSDFADHGNATHDGSTRTLGDGVARDPEYGTFTTTDVVEIESTERGCFRSRSVATLGFDGLTPILRPRRDAAFTRIRAVGGRARTIAFA